jgi:hypothetical protein
MAETTYLPSDLQRRYRVVLDQAKAGEARVRDLDGTSVRRILRPWSAYSKNPGAVAQTSFNTVSGRGCVSSMPKTYASLRVTSVRQ